jgi:hypothetical protein
MNDLKDMVRYHKFQLSELLEMTPIDYQLLKLMIIDDMQKELDRHNNGR